MITEFILLLHLLCKILIKQGDGADAVVELLQREVLIGRVDRVGPQAEAHQHRLDAEDFLEGRDDGDAAA